MSTKQEPSRPFTWDGILEAVMIYELGMPVEDAVKIATKMAKERKT